jgi:hypothetical protein
MTTFNYSPNNLPLAVMMLSGGVSASIAEVKIIVKLDFNHPIRHS